MNILIICNSASGLHCFRGMLIQWMIQQNHQVSAIVPQTSEEREIMEENELNHIGCKTFNLPIDRRGINPIEDFGLLRGYFHLVRKLKPDYVITYTIKPNVYGGIVSRFLRIPYAVNITGLGTAFQNDGMLRKIVTTLYKAACKNAKVVFFENAENRQIFLDSKIVQQNQTCLLNGAGVDLERYTVCAYPEDGNETRFLFVGRVMKEKGVDELFKAMQQLRAEGTPCSLDIVGRFEDDYKDVISKFQAEGWLHYHGYQSDVRPFIADSHCFVLPSWHEGMANTNLECAASGRPVITSNIHGCLEAVEDGVSGFLCEKQNAEDLYRVMKRFTELPYEERKAMGLAGRKRMENAFDKKIVVKETIMKLM